jgi:hypothetical protein
MRHVFPIALFLGLATVACRSEPEKRRERADEVEQFYGVAPSDARTLAVQHPELADRPARATFTKLAEALGLKRLTPDDTNAFLELLGEPADTRDALLAELASETTTSFLEKLRERFGYEPRIREARDLANDARKPELAPFIGGRAVDVVRLLRERGSRARVSLAAIPGLAALGPIPRARLAAELDRFAGLEIDIGVQELDPHALDLLAHAATDARQGEALQSLVRSLTSLQASFVDPKALESVAAVPSAALVHMLDRLGPTRAWHAVTAFDAPTAQYLIELSARPSAAALVAVLEESSDFQSAGTTAEARALVRIDAAAPGGRAREALVSLLRAHLTLDALDERATSFMVALVSRPELREAVVALHSAYGAWRPSPDELPALEHLAGVDVAPVARALRGVGYDLGQRTLSLDEADALAALARINKVVGLIQGLNVVFPRLVITTTASLRELEALAKAGVTREDVLRLDADSLAGQLDATKRATIVERVKKNG